MEKIQRALHEGRMNQNEEEFISEVSNEKIRKKTKQQLKKEQRAKEIEEFQKKGLSKSLKTSIRFFIQTWRLILL